jgi:SAM-dependent methyltransferase
MLPLARQNAYRERYKALRPGWRTSGEVFEALIRQHIGPGARVLDLGCGRGGVMELFWREVRLSVGLDPDHTSLVDHRAHEHPEWNEVKSKGAASVGEPPSTTFHSASPSTPLGRDAHQAGMPLVCGLGEALPFPNESFDLVIGLWVLEHLAQPERVLDEIRRILRSPDPASGAPGGHFIFLTPNALHPLIRLNRFSQLLPQIQRALIPRLYARAEADTFRVHYRANTPARLFTLAAAHGFRVASLRAIPDPTYLAFNDFFFRMSVLFERLLPEGWGVHVIGDWERR